jgi:hypothetical protein
VQEALFRRTLLRLGGDSTKLSPIPVALILGPLAVATTAIAQTDHAVKYHATINDVEYAYGVAPPASHVTPGQIPTPTAMILSSFLYEWRILCDVLNGCFSRRLR